MLTSLFCPWNSPGNNTGVGSHSLFQGIFPAQGLNPCLLHWQVDSLPLSPFIDLGFPSSSVAKESASNVGDPCLIPGLGSSPGEGIGYPLQYSWASLVAQLIVCQQCGRPEFYPWVGKIAWRRERLPPPVFWPGEFHGLYSPWGCKEVDTTEQLSLSLFSAKNSHMTLSLQSKYRMLL